MHGYHVHIRRDRQQPRYVWAKLTRSWWGGFGHQTTYTPVAEAWTDVDTMSGDAVAAAVLRDLLLALEDRLS